LVVASWIAAGCRSGFLLEAESANPGWVKSAFVIIAPKEKLASDDCEELVGPDSKGKYAYFAQVLLGEDKAFKLAHQDEGGLPMVLKVGKQIKLTVPKKIIEGLPGAQIALVVDFMSGVCRKVEAPLLAKQTARYAIGDSRIERVP
jgi:hypothetical protein